MGLQDNLQQGRDFTEKENKKFIQLLNNKKYEQAKNFADDLVNEGVSIPLINYSGNGIVCNLMNTNPKEAKKLTNIFSDYDWPCWLNDSSF